MGKVKRFKPITPGQRFKTVADFSELSKVKPLKRLTKGLSNTAGRSAQGSITVRRKGGGHKRLYRMIDFKRNKYDVQGRVATIEYDPNRSARIALLHYSDGEKRYILHPLGLAVGATVVASKKAKIAVGNALCLKFIPDGTLVHNIELYPGSGGQFVRSAGQSAQVLGKEEKYCNVKLPSGEVRRIFSECMATIGQLGNVENENVVLGKAGRARWLNRRPKVRGVAMNPVDHPHGGGEGKTSGGRHPVSPWGKPTKGYKTRKKNKPSEKFILYRKKKKK